MKDKIIQKLKITLKIQSLIIFPILLFYIVQNIFLLNQVKLFGITPRELEFNALLGIVFSWLSHGDFQHLKGNLLILIQLLFFFSIFDNNQYKKLFIVIFVSGLFTWLLGAPNSYHIGASGLIFGLLGYFLSSVVFQRNWFYLAVVIFMASEFYFILSNGLIPKEGVSFAAHFGGFIGGLLVGYMFKKSLNFKTPEWILKIKRKLSRK